MSEQAVHPLLHPGVRRARHRASRTLVAGGVLLVLLVDGAALAPIVTRYDPTTVDLAAALQAPSRPHPFGTDNYGRDVLTRALFATRVDLQIGVIAVTIPFVIGTMIGTLAGYYGGLLDTLVMRASDLVLAFPYLVLVIAIMAMLGPGLVNLYIAVTLGGWTFYARLIRGEFLVATRLDYVQAARALGASDRRIILRHLLPNTLSAVVIFAFADVVLDIMLATALGFLGLGVRPPTPEWGAMIADGRAFMLTAWWISFFPGMMTVIAGLAFGITGDAIADYLRGGRPHP
jgi:peptide/nickel transport system permease protein